MNLYRVTLRGMQLSLGSNGCHGVFYAVSNTAEDAYKMGVSELAKQQLGTSADRALSSIELLASEGTYPDCGCTLYIGASK